MDEEQPQRVLVRPWLAERDEAAVAQLVERTLLEVGWSDVAGEAQAVRELLAEPERGLGMVAEVNGGIIGVVVAEWWNGRPVMFVRWLVVESSFRRQRVGSALIDALEAAPGLQRMSGMVDQEASAAIGFWRRRGWTMQKPRPERRRQLMGIDLAADLSEAA